MSTLRKRVGRSAKAIAGGEDIVDLLDRKETKQLLVDAADRDVPPVTSISAQVAKLAERKSIDLRSMSVKQFIGTVVRVLLEEEGYVVAAKGVRTPGDPVFKAGSIYKKKITSTIPSANLLERLVSSLTDSEARLLISLLESRFRL